MAKFAVVLCTLIVSIAAIEDWNNPIVLSVQSSATNLISWLSLESRTVYQPLREAYGYTTSNFEMFGINAEYETGVIVKAYDAALASGEYSEDAISCADSSISDQVEKIISDAKSCSADLAADLTIKYEQFASTWEQYETYLNDQLSRTGNCWSEDSAANCLRDILNEVSSLGISTWFDILAMGQEVMNSAIEWQEIPSVCHFDTAITALQTQVDASVAAVQQCAANA